MDLAGLQRKLIAIARSNPPSDHVPLAFEQRILARIRASVGADRWVWWSKTLWRAATPCVVIMLLLGAWSWLASASSQSPGDLSQEFENTVLAAAEPEPAAYLSQ